MNDAIRNEDETTAPPGPVAQERPPGDVVYVYDAAGISEREGRVPLWLWLVVLVLLIWGVYYLVAYWNAPPVSV